MYKVILYYNFVAIIDPEQFCREHKKVCQSLNLFGRIYIAAEGINGTLSGTPEQIESYKNYLLTTKGFERTEFKEENSDYVPFVKLVVKTRPEIVTLKTNEKFDVQKDTGNHLSPRQWKEILESDEEYVLLDIRNDYESKIGYFEGAVRPDEKNFYDFPTWLDKTEFDKNKKILMYCTGGIRCEKFSALMKKKGYQDVNQLHGGIINYAKEIGGDHFKGKCFVFDDRLAVPIEKNQQEPLSRCEITGQPSDQYLNCSNPDCNRLFICSREGALKYEGCCCQACMESPRKRPQDLENIYSPTRKWYHYFDEKI
ncbi:MAG: rhodanese-related sulfurtransferase [Candidatus Omnitrophica bacterium]|nr:rhodanese-related sulfurtransferase [Candidatus Omnitrophota bacterium]